MHGSRMFACEQNMQQYAIATFIDESTPVMYAQSMLLWLSAFAQRKGLVAYAATHFHHNFSTIALAGGIHERRENVPHQILVSNEAPRGRERRFSLEQQARQTAPT